MLGADELKILSMVGTLCLNLMYFKVQGAREKNTKGQNESLTEPIKEPIVVCFAEKICKIMRNYTPPPHSLISSNLSIYSLLQIFAKIP